MADRPQYYISLTSGQVRAARALLGWSARDLAEHSSIHISTVLRLERLNGPLRGNISTIEKIIAVLEDFGIEFLNDEAGVGVRIRADAPHAV